jgi:hypothetical protein
MSMLLTTVLMLLPMSEAGEESGLMGALAVGGGALVLLLGMVFAVVAFGNGRDHS